MLIQAQTEVRPRRNSSYRNINTSLLQHKKATIKKRFPAENKPRSPASHPGLLTQYSSSVNKLNHIETLAACSAKLL